LPKPRTEYPPPSRTAVQPVLLAAGRVAAERNGEHRGPPGEKRHSSRPDHGAAGAVQGHSEAARRRPGSRWACGRTPTVSRRSQRRMNRRKVLPMHEAMDCLLANARGQGVVAGWRSSSAAAYFFGFVRSEFCREPAGPPTFNRPAEAAMALKRSGNQLTDDQPTAYKVANWPQHKPR
jgi:hypothetical protein